MLCSLMHLFICDIKRSGGNNELITIIDFVLLNEEALNKPLITVWTDL